MGGGDDELFSKKMTKEEKKAAAKAARDAKKKKKEKAKGGKEVTAEDTSEKADKLLSRVDGGLGGGDVDLHTAADALADAGTICTYAQSKGGVDARSKDINVQNFTMLHKGSVMLDESEVVLNYGNRYGLIGSNGSGKSTFLNALGARAVPIPDGIDIFHLKEEVEASEVTAFEAVMSVDEERARLERDADDLNNILTEVEGDDEKQEKIMEVRSKRQDPTPRARAARFL